MLTSTTALTEALKLIEKLTTEIESYHVDWSKLNSDSPDYDKNYKPEYPSIVKEAHDFYNQTRLVYDVVTIDTNYKPCTQGNIQQRTI